MSRHLREQTAEVLRAAYEAGPRLGDPCPVCDRPTVRIEITSFSDHVPVFRDWCDADKVGQDVIDGGTYKGPWTSAASAVEAEPGALKRFNDWLGTKERTHPLARRGAAAVYLMVVGGGFAVGGWITRGLIAVCLSGQAFVAWAADRASGQGHQ